jgi:hypothetical protein
LHNGVLLGDVVFEATVGEGPDVEGADQTVIDDVGGHEPRVGLRSGERNIWSVGSLSDKVSAQLLSDP